MRHALLSIASCSLLGLAGCCGCGNDPSTLKVGGNGEAVASAESVNARPIEWNGWEAFELDNGVVRVVVVPAIGRVMHYGFSDAGDAGNVLWTDPSLYGDIAIAGGDWQNFGGDKAWPWPQDDPNGWPTLFPGSAWPPPVPFEGVAWAGRIDGNAVVMEAPVAPVYNVQPTRTIRLDPVGSGLTVTTTFDPVSNGEPAAAWHVTQLYKNGATVVALPGDLPPDVKWLERNDSERMAKVATPVGEGGALSVESAEQAKVFFNVPRLAAGIRGRGPDSVFVQRVVAANADGPDAGYRDASDVAQVFLLSDGDGGAPGPWAELEFTAPIGRGSTLAIRWELLTANGIDVTDPAAVADRAVRGD